MTQSWHISHAFTHMLSGSLTHTHIGTHMRTLALYMYKHAHAHAHYAHAHAHTHACAHTHSEGRSGARSGWHLRWTWVLANDR